MLKKNANPSYPLSLTTKSKKDAVKYDEWSKSSEDFQDMMDENIKSAEKRTIVRHN
jgi:hypothetical protein